MWLGAKWPWGPGGHRCVPEATGVSPRQLWRHSPSSQGMSSGSSPGCPFLPGTAPLLGTKAAGTSLGELLCQAAPWSFLSHRTAPLQLLPRAFTLFMQNVVAKAYPEFQPGMLRAGFLCVCVYASVHTKMCALIDRKDSLHLPFKKYK